jgi:acyl-CoA reductase-like NAD-dependent aldehyde dehydrogenase
MGNRSGTSRVVLGVLAAVLVIAGLVLATTAPAGPSTSNKVDAYGPAPVPKKPTNPKTKADCDKYYSAANQGSEARGCRALAAYNTAKRSCAKKSGSKKSACLKKAKAAYKKAKAKVAAQSKAEKACSTAYQTTSSQINQQIDALDPSAPDYDTQYQALQDQLTAASNTQAACLKKAQKG